MIRSVLWLYPWFPWSYVPSVHFILIGKLIRFPGYILWLPCDALVRGIAKRYVSSTDPSTLGLRTSHGFLLSLRSPSCLVWRTSIWTLPVCPPSLPHLPQWFSLLHRLWHRALLAGVPSLPTTGYITTAKHQRMIYCLFFNIRGSPENLKLQNIFILVSGVSAS